MSRERDPDEIIPTWAAGLGGLLMVAVLAATTLTVLTREDAPAARASAAPVVESRALAFVYEPTGAVTVLDGESGETVADLDEFEGGFVSGVLRVLNRERAQHDVDALAPYRLDVHGDGRLALVDPATGRVIDINAFGRNQVETFAALL
ncbi:MAG: photosynthetic complex assembly protein PuhC [Paracoccaceae bacterium]